MNEKQIKGLMRRAVFVENKRRVVGLTIILEGEDARTAHRWLSEQRRKERQAEQRRLTAHRRRMLADPRYVTSLNPAAKREG